MRSAPVNLAAVFMIVLLASCSDQGPTEQRNPPVSPNISSLVGNGQSEGIDQEFERIARNVPSFGGFFKDPTGRVVVYLRNMKDQKNAGVAVRQALADRVGVSASSAIRFLPARFDVVQLLTWKRRALPVLSLPGSVFVDLDETINRVRVGVEDGVALGSVRAALTSLGMPPEAVVVEHTAPIVLQTDLRSFVRPLLGGLQLTVPDISAFCTLGFNATRAGVVGLVTASHCSTTQGGVNGSQYYQPILQKVPPSNVGMETVDPLFLASAGCPPTRICRNSDALFARKANTVFASEVARTTVEGTSGSGSLTLGTRVALTGKLTSPVVGTVVRKTGRSTGTTVGQVAASCQTVNVAGSNRTLFCQDFVSAASQAGDSGSPVWFLTSAGSAQLVGIQWGANCGPPGICTQYVYSPIAGIEADLGALSLTVQ